MRMFLKNKVKQNKQQKQTLKCEESVCFSFVTVTCVKKKNLKFCLHILLLFFLLVLFLYGYPDGVYTVLWLNWECLLVLFNLFNLVVWFLHFPNYCEKDYLTVQNNSQVVWRPYLSCAKKQMRERETERKTTKNKMDWELWNIRHVHSFCIRMKTNQLFRFRNLLLLVFISRMNIWLWSVIKYTHAHGNLLKFKKTAFSNIWRRCFHVNKYFQCVYVCVCVVRVRVCEVELFFPFLFFILKRKKKTGFKKVWKHDFRWLNWPKLYKVDYILMSVKDCCSWSLGVLWNDFLLSFFLSFLLSFFKLREKDLHFPFLCKFLLDSFWEHVHFCMWASTISLLLYGQP